MKRERRCAKAKRDEKHIEIEAMREMIVREIEREDEKQRASRETASERKDSRGCWTRVGRLLSSPLWWGG